MTSPPRKSGNRRSWARDEYGRLDVLADNAGLYLAFDESKYVTGGEFVVDGGGYSGVIVRTE